MSATDDNTSESDYEVEQFIRPKRVKHSTNDDSADLLGNFDDEKRKEILEGTYVEKDPIRNPSDSEQTSDDDDDNEEQEIQENGHNGTTENNKDNNDTDSSNSHNIYDGNLTKEQISTLLRGASKSNRFVLYVTNLNFDTTKNDLETYFNTVGTVKSIRIPKKRRGGFAFVEMNDIESFQHGFQLHDTELQGRKIKIQISEAGKKKSANKKNIIKQKNRKLAEMRNEQKTFTKSGKFYDKTLKKEKAKELLARKRWRKKPQMQNRN